MYPASTAYRLARTPADYRACHAFFRAEMQHPTCENEGLSGQYETEKITYPTVVAVRDKAVVGVLATKIVPPYGVVGSPFHIAYDIKNPVPVTFRLMDAYESALREAKVPYYTVVVPNYKPFAVRIFTELRPATLLGTVLDDRFNVYQVQVP